MELYEQIRQEYEHGAGTIRAVARKLGVHRREVRKALGSAMPAERKVPERERPKLAAAIPFIDAILEADRKAPRKQRHTAHRIAKGKTVLFVAEKLAALEVVRRRLDDAGLGIFCLEVHSHKTKKGALLNDLAQRSSMRGSFKDPKDLDRNLSIVEEKKKLLTQYASLINKTIEPFQATVFEILWARDICGQAMGAHRDRLGQLFLPVVVQYTRTQFTQTEQFLSVYAQPVTHQAVHAGSRVVLYAHYQSEEGRYLDALTLPAHIAGLSGSRMSLCCDILRLS